MRKVTLSVGLLACLGASAGEETKSLPPDQTLSAVYGGMELRNVGPFRGGRVDVKGDLPAFNRAVQEAGIPPVVAERPKEGTR